jgi:hypothetical protein
MGLFLAFVMSLAFSMSAFATLEKYELKAMVYEYDFATDGGAVGTIALRSLNVSGISAGCVVEDVHALIQTAFTSGGSATVTLGNSVDADGYMVNIFSLASANAALKSGQVAGALLWDDTNDAELNYYVPSAAAAIPKIVVGTAALTAGKAKFIFLVRCY